MADDIPTTGWATDAPPPAIPQGGWGSAQAATLDQAPTTGWAEPKQEDMPDPITALGQGVMHGAVPEVEQSLQTLRGETPQAPTEPPSPAAAPLEWSDLWHPSRGLSKIAYGVGESAPTLGAGLVGGVAGGLTPIPGGSLVGGALGAA